MTRRILVMIAAIAASLAAVAQQPELSPPAAAAGRLVAIAELCRERDGMLRGGAGAVYIRNIRGAFAGGAEFDQHYESLKRRFPGADKITDARQASPQVGEALEDITRRIYQSG